ncbi:MAG: hypothetical protein QXY50_02900 [Candidatus Caldarchaeum sp.]
MKQAARVRPGLAAPVAILSALLAVSAVSAVLLSTVRVSVLLQEPISMGSWNPALPNVSFPGQLLVHNNTVNNMANVLYKIRYRLNVSAEAGVFGNATLYVNNNPAAYVFYNGNTSVATANVNIAPSGTHALSLRIHTSPGSDAGKRLNVSLTLERLAP